MKSIVLIVEGRYGIGSKNMDVNVKELGEIYEGEDEECKDEYVLDCENFKGGIVCGSGDEGLEYVIGDDECSWEEMWEKLKEYGKELGYGDWLFDEWFNKIMENEEKVYLYDYKDFLEGGKYFKG